MPPRLPPGDARDRDALSGPVRGPGAGARAGAGVPAHLQRARTIALLMDNAIPIPGTGMRIGLDPLLGLVPGLGDLVGAGLSGYIVVVAARAGASNSVLVRMVGNIALDTLLGTVPALGDLFDAGFKSNARNLALLERHVATPAETTRSSAAIVGVVLLLLVLLAAGGLALAWLAARWLVSRLNGAG